MLTDDVLVGEGTLRVGDVIANVTENALEYEPVEADQIIETMEGIRSFLEATPDVEAVYWRDFHGAAFIVTL